MLLTRSGTDVHVKLGPLAIPATLTKDMQNYLIQRQAVHLETCNRNVLYSGCISPPFPARPARPCLLTQLLARQVQSCTTELDIYSLNNAVSYMQQDIKLNIFTVSRRPVARNHACAICGLCSSWLWTSTTNQTTSHIWDQNIPDDYMPQPCHKDKSLVLQSSCTPEA